MGNMQQFIPDSITPGNDLKLIQCGREICSRGHSFGPYIRDHHLFHFVTGGTGKYIIKKKEYILRENEMFYIPPGEVTYYQADMANPWSYSWIGLTGINISGYLKMMGLSAKRPILSCNPQILSLCRQVIDYVSEENRADLRAMGTLYLLIHEMIKSGPGEIIQRTSTEIYIDNAVQYIYTNIHKKTTVAELAEYIGIDRSYLCNIFKKKLGVSPQRYILDAKMKKACDFLKTTNFEIKYIAKSVGYDDSYVFSHAFKTYYKISPREYRNKIKEQQNS